MLEKLCPLGAQVVFSNQTSDHFLGSYMPIYGLAREWVECKYRGVDLGVNCPTPSSCEYCVSMTDWFIRALRRVVASRLHMATTTQAPADCAVGSHCLRVAIPASSGRACYIQKGVI